MALDNVLQPPNESLLFAIGAWPEFAALYKKLQTFPGKSEEKLHSQSCDFRITLHWIYDYSLWFLGIPHHHLSTEKVFQMYLYFIF